MLSNLQPIDNALKFFENIFYTLLLFLSILLVLGIEQFSFFTKSMLYGHIITFFVLLFLIWVFAILLSPSAKAMFAKIIEKKPLDVIVLSSFIGLITLFFIITNYLGIIASKIEIILTGIALLVQGIYIMWNIVTSKEKDRTNIFMLTFISIILSVAIIGWINFFSNLFASYLAVKKYNIGFFGIAISLIRLREKSIVSMMRKPKLALLAIIIVFTGAFLVFFTQEITGTLIEF